MEAHQPKRARTSQQESAACAATQTTLYLDTLPQDALMVILRRLSARPYACNWDSYVDLADALSVLECGGCVSVVAQSLFTALDLLVAEQSHDDAFSALRTTSLSQFNKLLLKQGPQLTKLSFASAPSRNCIQAQQFDFASGTYFQRCRQLRELTIADCSSWRKPEPLPLEPILAACGGVLQKLTILGNTHLHTSFVESIVRHCRALESLSLSQETVGVKMHLFWQVVGEKLKHLSCFPPCSPYNCRTVLLPISRYCKKLEDVEITGHMRTIPPVRFYSDMGERLRVLRFHSSCVTPTPDEFAKILKNCPRAMVDIFIRDNKEELLRVLGDRVRNLTLHCISMPSDEFVGVADKLTSLRRLTVASMDEDSAKFAKAMFHASKPDLEALSLSCVNMLDDMQEGGVEFNLLAALGHKVCSLREFSFSSWMKFDSRACVSVVNANRKLRRLAAAFTSTNYTEQVLVGHIKNVVRALAKHESIREVRIHLVGKKLFSKEVRDACLPLRGRELSLVVGNVQYLPTYRELP